LSGEERRQAERRQAERRQGERRQAERRQQPPAEREESPDGATPIDERERRLEKIRVSASAWDALRAAQEESGGTVRRRRLFRRKG
jgi:hypothetical protein